MLPCRGCHGAYRHDDRGSGHGRWRICCGSRVLFEDLRFAHAIKLVRGLARQKQVSSKRTVLVEMASAEVQVFHVYAVLIEPDSPATKKTSCGSSDEKAYQGLVALHADSPDDGLSWLGHGGRMPGRGKAFHKYVSLPIHPRMTDEAIDYVMTSVRELA